MGPTATPNNFVRRGGSGWTIFTFAGQPISFCQQVAHTSPVPVGQGVSAIQPMDEPYPIELITPAAAGMGQLVLNMFELFGTNGNSSKTWDRLGIGNASGASPFGTFSNYQNDTSQYGNSNLDAGGSNVSGTEYFNGAVDIVDIFIKQATISPELMSVTQIIRPPANSNGGQKPYSIQYIGCIITNVQDGETIDVGTLEVIKQITIAYRYQLRDGFASQAFAMRDAVTS
jgi:hypothetical protein